MDNYLDDLRGLIGLVRKYDLVVNEPAVLERLEAEERAYEEWLEDQWKAED